MSNIRYFEVEVTQRVRVGLDADKFDRAFADEFNTTIFYAGDPEDDDGVTEMLREHAEHIGQLQAREIWDNRGFIEGYGDVRAMGITAETLETETAAVERRSTLSDATLDRIAAGVALYNAEDTSGEAAPWKPIEEAPRDGRPLWLADEIGSRAAAGWHEGRWAYIIGDNEFGDTVEFEPTRFSNPLEEGR